MKTFTMLLILLLTSSCHPDRLQDLDPMANINEALTNREDQSEIKDGFFDLVNNHRLDQGKTPLEDSSWMDATANDHAEKMAKGLTAFGTSGSLERCKSIALMMGEDLSCYEMVSRGYKTAQGLFNAWLGDESKRVKLESSDFNFAGLGSYTNGSGLTFSVFILGNTSR